MIEQELRSSIERIGFLKAELFHDLEKAENVPFLSFNQEERTNPFLIIKNAKSIIVFLLPYYIPSERTNLSQYAKGMDYHIVAKKECDKIISILNTNGYNGVGFCDNGPLNERYLAKKCGLGVIGKNGFLIDEKYGSYVFISYVVTDCVLTPTLPMNKKCIECNKCIKACPTGALGDITKNPSQCLSYTTQKKGELTLDEKSVIKKSGYAFGCDICQSVCPMNKSAHITPINEFKENMILSLKKEDISNREFKRLYGNYSFSWRGKSVIDRNLSILNGKKVEKK